MATEAFTVRTESEAVQIEKITQGIAAADKGDLLEHDAVMREMEVLIEQKAYG